MKLLFRYYLVEVEHVRGAYHKDVWTRSRVIKEDKKGTSFRTLQGSDNLAALKSRFGIGGLI